MKIWKQNRFRAALIGLCFFVFSQAQGQALRFSAEGLSGNRSIGLQHFVSYSKSNWEFQHFSLLDFEYAQKRNAIYFVRNSALYKISKGFYLQAGIGLKNPGSFYSLLGQYRFQSAYTKLSLGSGFTWQLGRSWENTLSVEQYSPKFGAWQAYAKVFFLANLQEQEIIRGIAQFRLGLLKGNQSGGLALNLDRFSEGRELRNIGVFYKINFIPHEN